MILVEIGKKCNYYYCMTESPAVDAATIAKVISINSAVPTTNTDPIATPVVDTGIPVAQSPLPADAAPSDQTPPESTQAKEKKTYTDEIPDVVRGSVNSRAKELLNEAKKNEKPVENTGTHPLNIDLVSYKILQDKAQEPDQEKYPPDQIIKGFDSKGQPTGVVLRIVRDTTSGQIRVARPSETQGVGKIARIIGKKDDYFICKVQSGGQTRVPTEVILDAQLAGIYESSKTGPDKIFTPKERTVIGAYLEKRYTGTKDALSLVDNATLLEAARNCGLTLNESPISFLEKQKEIPEVGKQLTAEQTQYNKQLEDLTKELETKGLVAKPTDTARVMKTYGRREIPRMMHQLEQQRQRLMTFINTLPAEQQKQAQQNLHDISARMLSLNQAESGILSDGDATLEQFFTEDVANNRGRTINENIRNGNMAGTIMEVVEAKIENMPKEQIDKWKAFLRGLSQNLLLAGGGFGVLVIFLFFQSLQGKQQ